MTMNNGNNVRRLRLERAWSQEQLAEMTALSVRTIQRIENGHQPGLETLGALAAVFGTPVAALLDHPLAASDTLDLSIAEAKQRMNEEKVFFGSLFSAMLVCPLLFLINKLGQSQSLWSLWVIAIWGGILLLNGLRLFVFNGLISRWQKQRLQRLLRK